MYVFCLSCPSATFAHQHGGFVPREWLPAKSLFNYILRFTAFLSVMAINSLPNLSYCARVREFRVAFIELIFRKTHAETDGIGKQVSRALNRVGPHQ